MWTGPINEVLLWNFNLDAIDAAAVAPMLSPDERDRAGRFRFDQHAQRFIAARAALRYALAGLTSSAPEAIVFTYGEHGKPASGDLHFNLSHAEHRALVAVTRIAPVGVDVEAIKPERASLDVARRFFAAVEIAELERLAGAAYADAFFQLWARKEAVLKAVGTGIGGGLASFAVPLDAMPQAVHIETPDCWVGNIAHVFPYLVVEGFSSAVALLAHKPVIRPMSDTILRIPVRRTFK